MENTYATKVEVCEVKEKSITLGLELARQDERIKGNSGAINEIKGDVREIKNDMKSQKNMMIGIAASTVLTLVGMVVTLLS